MVAEKCPFVQQVVDFRLGIPPVRLNFPGQVPQRRQSLAVLRRKGVQPPRLIQEGLQLPKYFIHFLLPAPEIQYSGHAAEAAGTQKRRINPAA